VKLIENSNRFHRGGKPDKSIIIIGIPNVGKSTIINQLRNQYLAVKGKATQVGPKPGVTRNVLEKIRISNDPMVFLLDTPGISKPNIKDMHVGMKLAVCNTLNDHVIGSMFICDYLLWYLNTHEYFAYVKYMGLSKPEENSNMMLAKSAIANGSVKTVTEHGVKRTIPDYEGVAFKFLNGFRKGHFGRFYLDEDQLKDTLINSEISNLNNKQEIKNEKRF